MEKWKLLLFGLDCDRATYVNCLGYPEGSLKQKHQIEKQQIDEAANTKQAGNWENMQKV